MQFSSKVGKRARWFERKVTESSPAAKTTTREIRKGCEITERRIFLKHKEVGVWTQ